MILGAACISHTPIMERARAPRQIEEQFFSSLDKLGSEVADLKVDALVVFCPDHLNGFFYGLMPPFCIGINARSIGDYGTVEGELPVASDLALDLVNACFRGGIDVAFSHRMRVDHGFAQPTELLFRRSKIPPVIPIFVNCVVRPCPSFARVRALGDVIGHWAQTRPERLFFLGSGGLSHDPPLPSLDKVSPDIREALILGNSPSYAARFTRQSGVYAAGEEFARGASSLRAINADWDRRILDAFSQRKLDVLDNSSPDEIAHIAGAGANEVRTWVAALSAANARGVCSTELCFYEPIQEWITGVGVIKAIFDQSLPKGEQRCIP